MLAAFLLHRMTIKNTKRRQNRNTAESGENPAESPEKLESKTSQSDICRTCLSTVNLRPIFCNSEHRQISYKLKQITNLEIKQNDELSQKICIKCFKMINTALNFRIKCRQAEETLRNMAKTIVKTEPTSPRARKNITTETNHINKTTEECPIEQINITTVKVEYDADSSTENVEEPEQIKDIKPNIQIINKNNVIDKNLRKELPIVWEKNIPNSVNERVILDKNMPTAKMDTLSKRPKIPPKTAAERQKIYRDRAKKLDFARPVPIVKNTDTVHLNVVKIINEQKNKSPPPPRCPTCGEQLPSRSAYVAHLRTHVSALVCEECGKIFQNMGKLEQHQRAMHSLPRIHNCSYCNFSASNKDSLLVHERRHRGERPFVCDYCGTGFYSRRTLIQHIGVHLPDTIQCPLCPKRLRSLRLLSNHKAQKHGKRYSFQCPRCPKSFNFLKSIRQHLVGVHRIPRKEQPKSYEIE